MTDVPVQIVVAAFRNERTADQVLNELKDLQSDGQIKIDDAAVLNRDMNNQLHIKDTRDWGFGKGALAGGAAGVVLGLMTGPVGWAVLGTALVGGVAAKMHHTYGFNEARLRKLGDSLQPGNSAIVAVVEHLWVARVEAAMREQSTDILVESMSKDIAEQLAAGSDTSYSEVNTGEEVSMTRVAGNEDETQISQVTYTPQGAYAEAADITKDHITYGAAVANADGYQGVILEATPDVEAEKTAAEPQQAAATPDPTSSSNT